MLWGQLPLRGLWLWVALVAWRVLIMVLAARTGAHVAASTTPLLFTLGLNRLGQAAVILLRAMRGRHPVRAGEGRPDVPVRRVRRADRDTLSAILIP